MMFVHQIYLTRCNWTNAEGSCLYKGEKVTDDIKVKKKSPWIVKRKSPLEMTVFLILSKNP